MKNKTMSVLFASNNGCHMNDLTMHRTAASLPYGGRYRLIDFILSNMVASGITTVNVVTKSNYNSLMDHLRSGRDWDLNRKNSGIAIYPPFVRNTAHDVYRGKIEALYNIRGYMMEKNEDYVLLSNTNIAFNMDLEQVEHAHIATGADVTVLTYKTDAVNSQREIISTESDGRIVDMRYPIAADAGDKLCNLQIYLIRKDLLVSLVDDAYAHGFYDFEKDILQKNISSLKMYSYEVKEYVAVIDSIPSYFKHSMELLNPQVRDDLFYKHSTILTKVKDTVPTKYYDGAKVKNSIIADGCEIDGTVENSILFRSVKVQKGAVIKNSIVMEDNIIMENATLDYTVTDKDVIVQSGRHLSGYETYPMVVVKGKII